MQQILVFRRKQRSANYPKSRSQCDRECRIIKRSGWVIYTDNCYAGAELAVMPRTQYNILINGITIGQTARDGLEIS